MVDGFKDVADVSVQLPVRIEGSDSDIFWSGFEFWVYIFFLQNTTQIVESNELSTQNSIDLLAYCFIHFNISHALSSIICFKSPENKIWSRRKWM